MAVILRTDPPLTPYAVKALWDLVPFSQGRDPESVMRAIQGSELIVTAWDEELLVGTCRVITDGVYYATLWDVIVHPDYRGQGVGSRLVHAAIDPFRQRGFSYIALYSVAGVEPFYERLGFRRHPAGMRLQETRPEPAAPEPRGA
jgi:GNAT superfamily N-acetyltransferase